MKRTMFILITLMVQTSLLAIENQDKERSIRTTVLSGGLTAAGYVRRHINISEEDKNKIHWIFNDGIKIVGLKSNKGEISPIIARVDLLNKEQTFISPKELSQLTQDKVLKIGAEKDLVYRLELDSEFLYIRFSDLTDLNQREIRISNNRAYKKASEEKTQYWNNKDFTSTRK